MKLSNGGLGCGQPAPGARRMMAVFAIQVFQKSAGNPEII
jgi:hypothetical protein